MTLKQDFASPVSGLSIAALLSKNWGAMAIPGGQTLDAISVTAGTPVVAMSRSGGPGVITSMWMTCATPGSGSTQNMLNGILQVYVDGEATPSVSFDVGGPLSYFQWNNAASVKTFTKNFMAETSFNGSGTQFTNIVCNNIFLPIPYKSSVIVKFVPTQTAASFFFNTRFVTLTTPFPFKLFSQVTTYDNSIGLFPSANQWSAAALANGSCRLLNVGAGSGYIAYAWLYFLSSAANMNLLNLDINTYLNGKTPGTGYGTAIPDLTGLGIDGFFRYAYTANSVIPMSIMQAAVSQASATAGTFHGALDIAAMDGCWRFTNGAIMQLESGQTGAGSNTASLGSGVLYYMDAP